MEGYINGRPKIPSSYFTAVATSIVVRLLFMDQTMDARIAAELRPRLSSSAKVVVPADKEFAGLVSRWREYHGPTVAALVQATSESDIQEAVSTHMCPSIARNCLLHLLTTYPRPLTRFAMRVRKTYHSSEDPGVTARPKR